MEWQPKAALIAELADRLQARGSWCGETHLQKGVYFLQDLLGVPIGVDFILYKHGPYSFDLAEIITAMRARSLFEKEFRKTGYGASYVPTKTSVGLRERFPKTLGKYGRQLDFVAETFSTKGVAELEKLATALFVTQEPDSSSEVEKRAQRLTVLKPHVSLSDAVKAIESLDIAAKNAEKLLA